MTCVGRRSVVTHRRRLAADIDAAADSAGIVVGAGTAADSAAGIADSADTAHIAIAVADIVGKGTAGIDQEVVGVGGAVGVAADSAPLVPGGVLDKNMVAAAAAAPAVVVVGGGGAAAAADDRTRHLHWKTSAVVGASLQ